jgi:hypothetical protein
MALRNWTKILMAALLCFAVAGTAVAATSGKKPAKPKAGKYKGTTRQVKPENGKHFGIKFKITKNKSTGVRTIKNVLTTTRDKCPSGAFLRVTQNAFKSDDLNSKGRFKLTAGDSQQPAVLKGRVIGGKASGKLSDTSFSQDVGEFCHASTKWKASRVKPKH